MPRPSKLELERRAEQSVRVEKAEESIIAGLRKLLKKHLPALTKKGVPSTALVSLKIDETGKAAMRLEYQTHVTDGLAFELDDGQAEMQLDGDKSNPDGTGEPGETSAQ